ncbi:unnamed protein product [Dibothriocephalus latus]|uniref:Uncharacterized protein n=1 Tax=Dibothriocephalus latus TaxID=60516 RepID=A0A3P7LPA4_DIBLA|nr:unnamed protein product [Dibothriocephalus latus]
MVGHRFTRHERMTKSVVGMLTKTASFPSRQNRRNDKVVSAAVPTTNFGAHSKPPGAIPGSAYGRPTALKPSLEQSANLRQTITHTGSPATGANGLTETSFSPNLSQAVSGDNPSSRSDEDPFAGFGDYQPSEGMAAGVTGSSGGQKVTPSQGRRINILAVMNAPGNQPAELMNASVFPALVVQMRCDRYVGG